MENKEMILKIWELVKDYDEPGVYTHQSSILQYTKKNIYKLVKELEFGIEIERIFSYRGEECFEFVSKQNATLYLRPCENGEISNSYEQPSGKEYLAVIHFKPTFNFHGWNLNFETFWDYEQELISLCPYKYIDNPNHYIYYDNLNGAIEAYKKIDELYNKYWEIHKKRHKEFKLKEAKEYLEKLEKEAMEE